VNEATSFVAKRLQDTPSGDMALVLGNEQSGLSNEEMRYCQRAVFIPANPFYTSPNLAAVEKKIH